MGFMPAYGGDRPAATSAMTSTDQVEAFDVIGLRGCEFVAAIEYGFALDRAAC
jgi:hypothetical protein